jgi:serine O-acetyltransferase
MECFSFDESEYNPCPKSFSGKIIRLYFNQRYSMTTLMRLAQYFYERSRETSHIRWVSKFYHILSSYLVRKNQILNKLECAHSPIIGKRVVFHHPNVVITHNTVIESDVHIYGNVTFGEKNGLTPYIKKYAKIAGHSIVIGGISIGEKAIVAPGSVVLKDVPDGKIAGGVPAEIIGTVNEQNYYF